MVVLGGVLAALALLGMAAAPVAAVFVAAGLVLGLGFYMVHNSIQTRVTEVAPRRAARQWRCTPSISTSASRSGRWRWGWRAGCSGRASPSRWPGSGMLALGLRLGRR
jgi:hypothetical protein